MLGFTSVYQYRAFTAAPLGPEAVPSAEELYPDDEDVDVVLAEDEEEEDDDEEEDEDDEVVDDELLAPTAVLP